MERWNSGLIGMEIWEETWSEASRPVDLLIHLSFKIASIPCLCRDAAGSLRGACLFI